MKAKKLIRILVTGWFFAILLFAVLAVLKIFNLWETLDSLLIQNFQSSLIGMMIFELSVTISISFLLISFPWRFFSELQRDLSPDNRIFRLFFGMVAEYICFSLLEILFVISDILFLLCFKGSLPWILTNISSVTVIQRVVSVAWINFFLVIIFQSFIAFCAYKVGGKYEDFLGKFLINYLEGLLYLCEIFVCIIPFYFSIILEYLVILLFIIPYWLLIGVFLLNFRMYIDQRIQSIRDKTEQTYPLGVFIEQLISIYFPLAIISLGVPVPLYLVAEMGGGEMIVLQLVLFIISLTITSIYFGLGGVGFNTLLAKKIEPMLDQLKLQTGLIMANQATLIRYPNPILAREADLGEGEEIPFNERKIQLKIVCGQCFFTFKVKTVIRSDKTRSFPCPKCRSNATTPVWE